MEEGIHFGSRCAKMKKKNTILTRINFSEVYVLLTTLESHKSLSRFQNNNQHCVTTLLIHWKERREHIS